VPGNCMGSDPPGQLPARPRNDTPTTVPGKYDGQLLQRNQMGPPTAPGDCMGPENREITAQASAGGPKKSTRRGPGGFGAPGWAPASGW
jgi:hypothetical protein